MAEKVVKSVGRVFAVLEAFARVQSPLTAIEIGRRLDYPASSTAALLKSMVSLGYLAFDRSTRSYLPTIRLGMLTAWLDGAAWGTAALDRLIEDLHVQTGETIIIAAQSDLAMKYLLTRPGVFPVRFLAPAGMLRPLCGSGTGWALLASKTDEEVRRLVQTINRGAPALQPRDALAAQPRSARPVQPRGASAARAIDLDRLLDLLAQVRRQGYAASYGSVVAGSGVIAMALPGPDGRLVLGVGGPVERLERSEAAIVQMMQAAIQRYLVAASPPASPHR